MKLMESHELVDDDFTLPQAVLAYVWSRMAVIDEVCFRSVGKVG